MNWPYILVWAVGVPIACSLVVGVVYLSYSGWKRKADAVWGLHGGAGGHGLVRPYGPDYHPAAPGKLVVEACPFDPWDSLVATLGAGDHKIHSDTA